MGVPFLSPDNFSSRGDFDIANLRGRSILYGAAHSAYVSYFHILDINFLPDYDLHGGADRRCPLTIFVLWII